MQGALRTGVKRREVNLAQYLQAAPARYHDVEHDHIPFLLPKEHEGLLGVTRLAKIGPVELRHEDFT